MIEQANKHRKKVNYKLESKIFLNEKNIIMIRSFKKLNNKMLKSFINLNFVDSSYKLKLLNFIHVHNVFHFNLLRFVIDDFLSD